MTILIFFFRENALCYFLQGYHAELVCFTPWVNGDPPSLIKCLTLNANYGLMAYGNNSGLVIGKNFKPQKFRPGSQKIASISDRDLPPS